MMFIKKYSPTLVILLMTSKIKSEGVKAKNRIPPIEQFGAITKWMSDPLPKGPMKPVIMDKPIPLSLIRNDKRSETIRVGDRVNSYEYRPNIDLLNSQNCFAINFGWPTEISIPSTTLSLKSKSPLNSYILKKFVKSTPSGCILVMVGARFMHRMHEIVQKIKEVSTMLSTNPLFWEYSFSMKTLIYFGVKIDDFPSLVNTEDLPVMVYYIIARRKGRA